MGKRRCQGKHKKVRISYNNGGESPGAEGEGELVMLTQCPQHNWEAVSSMSPGKWLRLSGRRDLMCALTSLTLVRWTLPPLLLPVKPTLLKLSHGSGGLGGVVNTNMHFLCEVAQNPSTLEGTHVMSTKIQSSNSHMTTWGQGCVVWTSPKHPIGNSKRWFQFLREKQPLSSVLLWKRNAANVKGILVEVGKYYERIGQIN